MHLHSMRLHLFYYCFSRLNANEFKNTHYNFDLLGYIWFGFFDLQLTQIH